MSILVATPCYGGVATVPYLQSCLNLQDEFLRSGIDHSFLHIGNESLITRARNTCVAAFLETDFESLLFIDADIEFSPLSVSKLWNLDVDVAVGAYPMKKPDKPLSVWKDGKIVKAGEFTEPVSVDYGATGFMLIKRGVFEKLQEISPEYEENGVKYDYFQTKVVDKTLLSEDFWFCEAWRELGGEIILDPSIKLNHYGTIAFTGE